MTDKTEDERWFALTQDKRREWKRRKYRSESREKRAARDKATRSARKIAEAEGPGAVQAMRVENNFKGMMPAIKMNISEWVHDEHGNLSRVIWADYD